MHKSFYLKILLALGGIGIFVPTILFASTSTNYQSNQERGGPIDFKGNSPNYQFDAEVGHPAVGESTSTNYIFDHGAFWIEVTTTSSVTIRWAVPELRSGAPGTNDDTQFFLTVRKLGATIFSTPLISSTTVSGTYATPIDIPVVSPATYDIGIKGHQHLTKILRNVAIAPGSNVLNFSQTDFTSTTKGTVVLIAGDVNGAGTTTSTLGDDKINALDLTTVLAAFNNNDPSGNAERANVNQDTKVNALDLTTVLKNFNAIGDL